MMRPEILAAMRKLCFNKNSHEMIKLMNSDAFFQQGINMNCHGLNPNPFSQTYGCFDARVHCDCKLNFFTPAHEMVYTQCT
jgi:hypothetical protein